jgi:hypothetical protein
MAVLAHYHDFSNAVKGSFASFARLYRYFNDAVRWFIEFLEVGIIATFATR